MRDLDGPDSDQASRDAKASHEDEHGAEFVVAAQNFGTTSDAVEPSMRIRRDGTPAEAHLSDMAKAFRMNAEALTRLQEMQQDLAKSVRRTDRSEMVLQNTKALNDTFRNLTMVQRELLDRFEDDKSASAKSPMIPLMLLGLLAAVIGGTYVMLKRLDTIEQAKPDAETATITAERLRDEYRQGINEGKKQSEVRLEALSEQLNEERGLRETRVGNYEQELARTKDQLDEVHRTNAQLKLDQAQLTEEAKRGQHIAIEKQLLEDKLRESATKHASVDHVISRLQADLAIAKRDNGDLRSRFARHGLGMPPDPRYGDSADNYPVPASMLDIRTGRNAPVAPSNAPAVAKRSESRSDRIEEARSTIRAMQRDGTIGNSTRPNNLRKPSEWNRGDVDTLPASGLDDGTLGEPVPPRGRATAGAISPAPRPIPMNGSSQPSGSSSGRDLPTVVPSTTGVIGSSDLIYEGPPGLPGSTMRPPERLIDAPRVDREVSPRHTEPTSFQRSEALRVRKMVNRMLGASTTSSGGEFWQLSKIRALHGDRFEGVEAVHYDETGQVMEKIRANDLHVNVDRKRHLVNFTFRGGERITGNQSQALDVRGFTVPVAEGEVQSQAWSSSGLRMVRAR